MLLLLPQGATLYVDAVQCRLSACTLAWGQFERRVRFDRDV